MHALEPLTSLYVPPTHAGQGPPFGPVYPELQVQLLSSGLPVAAAYEFAGHVVHACDPSQFLYFPTAHSAQGPPSGPVNPATHEQIILAETEDWFCAHVVHSCTPINGLNLPASHATHARAYTASYASAAFSTCVYPVLHTHAVTFVDAATELRLPAHDAHSAGPVVFLNLPTTHATHTSPVFPVYPILHGHSALAAADQLFAWQLLHADVPRMRLYVPAGHAWHPLPSASAVPVNPALHWHATLPLLELVLPGQATHAPPAWYVSAGQAEQVRLKRHLDGAFGYCTK